MALSLISSISSQTTKYPTKPPVVVKPTNVNFLATIGAFTTVFGGTTGSFTSSTTKTITGTQYYNGTYIIKCNYWAMEGTISNPGSSIGRMFDNNTSTYGHSVWTGASFVVNFGHNGNQIGFIDQSYDTTTGAYKLGSTFKTTIGSTNYFGDYIDIILPIAIVLKKYRTMTRIDATARYPRQRYIFGSNDGGTTWTLLSQWLVNTAVAAGTYSEVTISYAGQPTSYTLIRLVINSVNSGSGGFWNLAEINMIFDVA